MLRGSGFDWLGVEGKVGVVTNHHIDGVAVWVRFPDEPEYQRDTICVDARFVQPDAHPASYTPTFASPARVGGSEA